MKNQKYETKQGASSSEKGSKTNGVSRRRFLQITGSATAAAAIGTTVYLLNDDSLNGKTDQADTVATTQPAPKRKEMREFAPGEAAALRHLRHRRHAIDGTSDSIFGSQEICEHDCTQSLFGHQL